jgi:hypothetical protein
VTEIEMRKFLTVLILLLIPIGWFFIEDKISFGFYAFVMVCFAAGVAGGDDAFATPVPRRQNGSEQAGASEPTGPSLGDSPNLYKEDGSLNLWHS